MPLLRIQSYPGIRQIFIAGEDISDLATVEVVTGAGPGRRVAMGSTANQHLAAGVARGEVESGAVVRVVTHGIVSGVKTDQDVNAGDRLAIATSGVVTPLNTITASGLISGLLASGAMASGAGMVGFSGFITSGFATASFNTGRLVGKALTSGLSGLGIEMLVSLG